MTDRAAAAAACARGARPELRRPALHRSCAATAPVVADTAGRWPLLEDLTADFVYLRLHGDKELYASGYCEQALARWAARIAAWCQGRQVRDAKRASTVAATRRARELFCYFDNDIKVHAPYDAADLAQALGLPTRLEQGARERFRLRPLCY